MERKTESAFARSKRPGFKRKIVYTVECVVCAVLTKWQKTGAFDKMSGREGVVLRP